MKKIILFELNEVPFRVMDDYCESNPESALSRMYRSSNVASTEAPDTSWLHPWCTWPTLHRGVPTEKHMLTNLSQDLTEADAEFPPIWKILASNGVSVGLGGSLHSWPLPKDMKNFVFYLPDTFASDDQAYPDELRAFQRFNLAMVDRSARNVSRSIALSEALDVLKNSGKLGFGVKTARNVARQLIHETVNPARKGRRRVLQSMLAFDAFMTQLEANKPDFATFFTNHVASSMHRYWVAKFPQDFSTSEYGTDFVHRFEGEIDYAMGIANDFLGRLLRFSDQNREYLIVLTTSMGQAACEEKIVSRQVYVDNPDLLMANLGVQSYEYERRRVMAPRFAAIIDREKRSAFRSGVESLKVAGDPIHYEELSEGYYMLHFGQSNLLTEEEYAEVNGQKIGFEVLGLKNVIIEDAAGSTGYHIPGGMLVTYDPDTRSGNRIASEVPTTEIAPALLTNFGIRSPQYMNPPQSAIF